MNKGLSDESLLKHIHIYSQSSSMIAFKEALAMYMTYLDNKDSDKSIDILKEAINNLVNDHSNIIVDK